MFRFVPAEELFGGRHFDAEIVVLCVRWYSSFKLSYTPEFEKRVGAVRRSGGRLLQDG